MSKELAKKLDKEIDDYMDMLAAKNSGKKKEPIDIDKVLEELQYHPAFMKELPTNGELPEAIEALQAMKYDDDDSPNERAIQHKIDGNKHFQYKKYRWATEAYTLGLKLNCDDRELNGILYANRAAAQFRLGNYRSAFKDCIFSCKFIPNHPKAVLRGAESLLKLGYASKALLWIENADLKNFDENTSLKMRQLKEQAVKKEKVEARNDRKDKLKNEKERKEKMKLLATLKERNVFTQPKLPYDDVDEFDWSMVDVTLPQLDEVCRVRLDENGNNLIWPVLLRYPESGQTDFIKEFDENCTLQEQLNEVLAYSPPWDVERKYRPDVVKAYYFHTKKETRCSVNLENTLAQILTLESFYVSNGLVILDIML